MDDTLPRTRGNRYALSVLKNRRATLAAEIVQLEQQIRHRKELLVHVDATLQLLDPSSSIDANPAKRLRKRIKLFRQGVLGRMILDALRRAERPLTTAEIATAILEAGGHGESARPIVTPRVPGNLSYLMRRGAVYKIGNGRTTRWHILFRCDVHRQSD